MIASAPLPDSSATPEDPDTGSFESHFRDPAFAAEAPLAWQLGQQLQGLPARRYDEFADVIASGSETRPCKTQPRFNRALHLVERTGAPAMARTETGPHRRQRTLGSARSRTYAGSYRADEDNQP